MNIPLKEYIEVLNKAGKQVPLDSKIIEHKALIHALLEKMLYFRTIGFTRISEEDMEQLFDEAEDVFRLVEFNEFEGTAVMTSFYAGAPAEIPPSDWHTYHHQNCGTKFRGCDPDNCPKDKYERTGEWRPELRCK